MHHLNEKKRKALKAWFFLTCKCDMTIPNYADDIKMKEQELKLLDEMRQVMVDKFDRTRKIISNTQELTCTAVVKSKIRHKPQDETVKGVEKDWG